jgi:hypothetical protein
MSNTITEIPSGLGWQSVAAMIARLLGADGTSQKNLAGHEQLMKACREADAYRFMLDQNWQLQRAIHDEVPMSMEQATALFHLKVKWKNDVRVLYSDNGTVITQCGSEGSCPMVIGICEDGSTHS